MPKTSITNRFFNFSDFSSKNSMLYKLIFHFRSSESSFNRPSIINSCGKTSSTNSEFFCPIRYTLSFPIKCNQMIRSSISRLFLVSTPGTILRRIIFIVINSINRSFRFTKLFNMVQIRFMHVVSKLYKRFPDTLNASTSIFGITKTSRIIASIKYAKKNRIKSGSPHSMFIKRIVFTILISHNFKLKTDVRLASGHPFLAARLVFNTQSIA